MEIARHVCIRKKRVHRRWFASIRDEVLQRAHFRQTPVDNWKSFHFFASANSHLGMRPTLVYADTFYEACTANRVVIHQETVQWTSSCSNRDTLLEVCLRFFGDCWVVIKRTIRKDETGDDNKSTIKSTKRICKWYLDVDVLWYDLFGKMTKKCKFYLKGWMWNFRYRCIYKIFKISLKKKKKKIGKLIYDIQFAIILVKLLCRNKKKTRNTENRRYQTSRYQFWNPNSKMYAYHIRRR